ncbi:RNA guanine-7 methyltransferase [Carabus blaptoides fortunei]
MSDDGGVYYSGGASENVNEWGDNDDLQALMHAAADANARDNEEALLKEDDDNGEEDVVERPVSPVPEPTRQSVVPKRKLSTDDEVPKQSKVQNERKRVSGYYKSTDEQQSPTTTSARPSLKRKHNDTTHDEPSSTRLKTNDGQAYPRNEGHANVVAAHYNTLEDKGLDERLKSRIFYMRNFNNWIKSMLINEYLSKVKEGMRHNAPIRVMDMCCGKGGDLLKWRKGNISYLICTDIASVSLEQCESRYRDMLARSHRERNAGRVYRAEFISADCTKVRLREKYNDPSIKLELVSCQFAFHYSFESLPQAECMLRNAAECLQPDGYFIGTIPDARVIVARQRKANASSFGNDVYQISFQSDTAQPPPLFGTKYNFHLDGVVDCPEFLVYFPTFVKLAKKYGLELVNEERFEDFYARVKGDGCQLLQKMQCLETYPPHRGNPLVGTGSNDYKHAADYVNERQQDPEQKIGTLSQSEWEAASLYLTFAFRKGKTTWDANGKPQYEFR